MIRDSVDRMMTHRTKKDAYNRQGFSRSNYPTVFDVDDFQAREQEQTIRGIMNGQLHYHGLGDGQSNPLAEAPPKSTTTEARILALFEAQYRRMKEPI